MGEPACEGLTARWCPRCGTCTCPRGDSDLGDSDLDDPSCPLHAPTSDHAGGGPDACARCEGDGEVSHGSCSVPDCEHADPCPVCGGSGKRPDDDAIAALRQELGRVAGDLMVAQAELDAFKARDAERPHPFDEREPDPAHEDLPRTYDMGYEDAMREHDRVRADLSLVTKLSDDQASALREQTAELDRLRAALRTAEERATYWADTAGRLGLEVARLRPGPSRIVSSDLVNRWKVRMADAVGHDERVVLLHDIMRTLGAAVSNG